jgi:fructose-bisphosphate aldolase, class I
MNIDELKSVARAIVADQKGILAADESGPTIKKRFDAIKLECSEENRRRYREILFTSAGVERYLGGVILYDETLRQSSTEGVPFTELLARRGIFPGIKVDSGAKPLALHPGEKITEGLDGLRERLQEYSQLGAKFAKWRGVIEIDAANLPSDYAIRANAHALARYAALCQEAGIVPIVEPEVLMDDSHNLARCGVVSAHVLQVVFEELEAHGVALEGMLLKPNMIIAGMKSPQQADVHQVAEATMNCLTSHVPTAVPGIVFLSGGQSAEDATAHLSAMNQLGPFPWQVSFSYGRALQAPVLDSWKGVEQNVAQAQNIFLRRCELNSLACAGKYDSSMESGVLPPP